MKLLHYYSGVMLSLFVLIHILNHLMILRSELSHLVFMNKARKVYRQPVMEIFLLIAVLVQIISGILLVITGWNKNGDLFDRIQVVSGLYLSFFLAFHISAVMIGRYKLRLDTNLYYGAGVMNSSPQRWIFIPYYTLAMLSWFFHMAVWCRNVIADFSSLGKANYYAIVFMTVGVLITIMVIKEMSNLTSMRK